MVDPGGFEILVLCDVALGFRDNQAGMHLHERHNIVFYSTSLQLVCGECAGVCICMSVRVCVCVCLCVCLWAVLADLVGFEILVLCDVALESSGDHARTYLHGSYGGIFC